MKNVSNYVKSLFTDNNRFYPLIIGYFLGGIIVLIVTGVVLNIG